MADTYSKLYVQIVFAVKYRQNLISPLWEDKLYSYITGIVQSKGQKMLQINGVPDHIHIFINIKPDCCLADLVREIKKSSNHFINDNFVKNQKFAWQNGYGVFSYHASQIEKISNYIKFQNEHHQKESFQKEYTSTLREFDIKYNEKYLFEWIE